MNGKAAVAIGIVVALIGGYYWYSRGAGQRALAQCKQLQAQRSLLSVQGTDTVTIARLDIAIRECLEAARAAGATFDSGDINLRACTDKEEQISQEWRHFRGTDYSDILKRGNIRSSILSIGAEMARCYTDAISNAESVATIDRIRTELRKAIASSDVRARCYHVAGDGCDRYLGSVEADGQSKSRQERAQVGSPLRQALVAANAKRDALRSAIVGAMPQVTPTEAPI